MPLPPDPESAWHAQRIGDTVFERPDEGSPCATPCSRSTPPARPRGNCVSWRGSTTASRTTSARRPPPPSIRAGPHQWHVSLCILGASSEPQGGVCPARPARAEPEDPRRPEHPVGQAVIALRQQLMREIVNAVPPQGCTGCQWDLFPHDLPPRSAPIPRLTWH